MQKVLIVSLTSVCWLKCRFTRTIRPSINWLGVQIQLVQILVVVLSQRVCQTDRYPVNGSGLLWASASYIRETMKINIFM